MTLYLQKTKKGTLKFLILASGLIMKILYRSPLEVFLGRGVLKICSKFTRELVAIQNYGEPLT